VLGSSFQGTHARIRGAQAAGLLATAASRREILLWTAISHIEAQRDEAVSCRNERASTS